MGRKAVGEKPMTATQRKQRQRALRSGKLPAHGTVLEFRLALLRFVEVWRLMHSALTTKQVTMSLEQLELCLRMDDYAKSNGREPDWVLRHFLQHSDLWDLEGQRRHDATNWR